MFVWDRSAKLFLKNGRLSETEKLHETFVVSNYKKQKGTAHDEIVNWNLVSYPMTQFLHYFY